MLRSAFFVRLTGELSLLSPGGVVLQGDNHLLGHGCLLGEYSCEGVSGANQVKNGKNGILVKSSLFPFFSPLKRLVGSGTGSGRGTFCLSPVDVATCAKGP